MKKICFVLLFLMVCTSVFAKKQEIAFWHSLGFHIKDVIDELADEYNDSHPGVKIEPVFQGLFEDMQVKMLTAAVTRQLPAIAQVQFEYLDSYVQNGLIEPIDDIIPEEDRKDIHYKMWEVATRDGRTYGIPFCVSTTVFFYNEDAFRRAGLDPDRPPDTWDEMIEMGKILTEDTDGDGLNDKYAMMFWMDGFYGFAPFLWANGGRLFTADGKRVNLTTPEMLKTVTMLHDLVFKHEIMPQKWTDWEGGQAFLTGRLAMGPFTSAAISYGEQNLPWKLRIAPLPSIDGNRYTLLGGSCLVNFAKKKKVRRTVNDFMLWLVSKENTIRIHKEIGYIPVRESALNSLSLRSFHKKNPNFKVPVDSLEFARSIPQHEDYYKINEKIGAMLQRIILDASDPADELKRTEIEINTMLE